MGKFKKKDCSGERKIHELQNQSFRYHQVGVNNVLPLLYIRQTRKVVEMPTQSEWIDLLKYAGTLGAGGLAGAVLNNYLIDKRNRIQKISKSITVSYVDVPSIMPGFNASISLSKADENKEVESYSFKRIAIIRLELQNISNKDYDSFAFGIDLPLGTQGIGLQMETPDRYHNIVPKEGVSIDTPRSQFDFKLEPFNRKESYSITIVASTNDENITGKITLSKTHSIVFVDPVSIEKDFLNALTNFLLLSVPVLSVNFSKHNSTKEN